MQLSGLCKALLLGTTALALSWSANEATAGEGVWTSNGLIGKEVQALALNPKDPQTLYAATFGLYKSTNGGESWREIGRKKNIWAVWVLNISSLVVDPLDTNVVYAASYKLFKSTDGGLNWSEWSEFPREVSDLEIDPHNPSVMYACGGQWFFKSSDSGLTWEPVRTFLSLDDLAIDPQNPKTVYAATYEGIYKTQNGGWDWDKVSDKGFSVIAIDPKDSSIMYGSYGGWGRGIFRSEDGGRTWEEMTQKGLGGLGAYAIAVGLLDDGSRIVYIGTSDGVFSIILREGISVEPLTWGKIKMMWR